MTPCGTAQPRTRRVGVDTPSKDDRRMTDQYEQRLARIERKIDTLADAVISMARIEERMISLFTRMDAYDKRQDHMGQRLMEVVERVVEIEKRSLLLNVIERFAYIVVTASVAYIFWVFQQ